MLLLDDVAALTPADLPRCEYALTHAAAAARGLVPALTEPVFMAERIAELAAEQRARVLDDYAGRYDKNFRELDAHLPATLAQAREQHAATLEALAGAQVVTGGALLIEADTPGDTAVLGYAAPLVFLRRAGGISAGAITGEQFPKATDIGSLGGHVLAARSALALGTDAFLHAATDRRFTYAAEDLASVAAARFDRLARIVAAAMSADAPISWTDLPDWGAGAGFGGIEACGFCAPCKAAAVAHRDVQLVWGMRRGYRARLAAAGITTIETLAAAPPAAPPAGVPTTEWEIFVDRARLQLAHEVDQAASPEAVVPVRAHLHDPGVVRALPVPDPGDIFFDFEGDPLWVESNRNEWGLEYLFGLIEADTGEYVRFWASSQAEEKQAFVRFLAYLRERRAAFGGMHVYHFAFYEPATMRRLARRHRTGYDEVEALLGAGVFVDLYEVVKAGVNVASRSYGLKALEPLYMGADLRSSDVTDGGAAVAAYENAVAARDSGDTATWEATLADLADYNRYDCESTRRLRDWLIDQLPAGCAPGEFEQVLPRGFTRRPKAVEVPEQQIDPAPAAFAVRAPSAGADTLALEVATIAGALAGLDVDPSRIAIFTRAPKLFRAAAAATDAFVDGPFAHVRILDPATMTEADTGPERIDAAVTSMSIPSTGPYGSSFGQTLDYAWLVRALHAPGRQFNLLAYPGWLTEQLPAPGRLYSGAARFLRLLGR